MSPPSPSPGRLHWHQFRLRTLLVAMSLAGILLAWWFHPFVVEQHYKDGQPRTRFILRRDWQGRRVAHGKQTWYLPDGTKIERTNYGEPLTDNDFTTLLSSGPNPNFDSLIWLIVTTIEPKTWDEIDNAPLYYPNYTSVSPLAADGLSKP